MTENAIMGARQKEGPPKRAFELTLTQLTLLSGGLVVDVGEVVLSGLRTVGDELAEMFAGRLRPLDQHFAARTDHVRLDLDRLVERLCGRQPVDAGEERLGVLIQRLLAVAADVCRLAAGIGNRRLDHGSNLLRPCMQVSSALLGGAGGLLDELAGSLGNFQVLEGLERLGYGRKSFLYRVQHRLVFGVAAQLFLSTPT